MLPETVLTYSRTVNCLSFKAKIRGMVWGRYCCFFSVCLLLLGFFAGWGGGGGYLGSCSYMQHVSFTKNYILLNYKLIKLQSKI